jgi:enediyne biosynthesis protein E4
MNRLPPGVTLAAILIFSVAAVAPAGEDEPLPRRPAVPVFADVTAALGVRFAYRGSHTSKKYLLETMGPGVALFDYDDDGRLDLFVANGAAITDPSAKGAVPKKEGPEHWNRLYHQKADGTFEDVTEAAGLPGAGYGMGVAAADYDNDGRQDLYVTAYGGNRLYRNEGGGRFADVTDRAGVAGSGWSTSAAWVDLDADGRLDLLVARYLEWDFDDVWCGERREGFRAYCHPDTFPPVAPLVYRNEGDGRFAEVSRTLGLAKPGKGLGVAIADYDRDGRVDVFVANDSMLQFLYRNKGEGAFEEVGLLSQVAVDCDGRTYAGMGVDFADYDNDARPDLVVNALANQGYALYRNAGDGGFTYESHTSGLGRLTLLHSGWGMRFIDYDGDGWKDLLVAQGHVLDTIERTSPNLRYREPLLLAWNDGRRFVDVSSGATGVFAQEWAARGLAIGDIDNDGRLDAVVATNDGPLYILRNETATPHHWLSLRLVGRISNRDAIGAEVTVRTAVGSQLATVTTAGSYLSSSDRRVHFGLGAAETVDVEIRWPSGIRQRLEGVNVDRLLRVDEPAGGGAS